MLVRKPNSSTNNDANKKKEKKNGMRTYLDIFCKEVTVEYL